MIIHSLDTFKLGGAVNLLGDGTDFLTLRTIFAFLIDFQK